MKLYTHKTTPACLSHIRLARLASGDLPTTEADNAHLAHCDACTDIFRSQQEDVGAMTVEALPPRVRAKMASAARRSRGLLISWPAWAALAAGVCAALLVIPRFAAEPPPTNIKGMPALAVSITRDGALVVDEKPIESVGRIVVGDMVRVRVIDAQGKSVQLDICSDEDGCETLFWGQLPRDGWVPAGLQIDSPTPTILRLRVCPPEQPVESCKPREFTLRTR